MRLMMVRRFRENGSVRCGAIKTLCFPLSPCLSVSLSVYTSINVSIHLRWLAEETTHVMTKTSTDCQPKKKGSKVCLIKLGVEKAK